MASAWTTPPTFASNVKVTSANLNAIAGNTSFLRGDTTWTAPTLGNSWVNFGGSANNAGYRIMGDFVQLRGIIKLGTLGAVAFTLPAGYRPTATLNLATVANGAFARLDIDSSGNVTPGGASSTGSNVSFSLDGIVFSVI